MDSLGVDIHVLSPYSGFYNYQLDTAVAIATSQESNDEIHQMSKSWPDRFAGLATLPMQDVKAAITELERVMVQLGFKGAMINDQVNGRTLDEPEFLPFWKAAEQLGALILFHQAGETIVSARTKRYHLPNTIGNLADRAVTFASLVFGGVMDACPDLKICLAPRRRVYLLWHWPDGLRLAGPLRGPSAYPAAPQRVFAAFLLRLHRLHGAGVTLSHRYRWRRSRRLRHRLAL